MIKRKNTIKLIEFGKQIEGIDERVLNERELRAGAGILFLFAFISFVNAWSFGDFFYTKLFVIAFIFDFAIRIFINPALAPSLILGSFFVRQQAPEYVGAKQKRFAWGIGLMLATLMFFLIVINNVIGPLNLFTCLTCLVLLFFESAFGICLGCKLYNAFYKDKAQNCPGGTCETEKKNYLKISTLQIGILIFFLAGVFGVAHSGVLGRGAGQSESNKFRQIINQAGDESENKDDPNCQAPDWAKKIGHEEQWKLHHGCKE